MTLDRNAIAARIEFIASTYRSRTGGISENDHALIAFARRHGQSLDWILDGNMRVYVCRATEEKRGAAGQFRSPASGPARYLFLFRYIF